MSKEELQKVAYENFEKAAESGRWMAVFFRIEAGKVEMNRTTCDFPSGDFLLSVGKLAHNLCDERRQMDKAKEKPEKKKPGKLPPAPQFPKMFGQPEPVVVEGQPPQVAPRPEGAPPEIHTIADGERDQQTIAFDEVGEMPPGMFQTDTLTSEEKNEDDQTD